MVKYLLDTCIINSILRGDKEIQAKVEEVAYIIYTCIEKVFDWLFA